MKKTIFIITLILSFSVSAEINNKSVSLEKFKGSVVVLYFFGDDMDKWNKPITELNKLQEKFKEKNVKVGAITPKSMENIKSFTKSIDFLMFAKSIDFTVVAESDTAKKYKIKPPYVYVISPEGKIYYKSTSLDNVDGKIEKLIAGSNEIHSDGTNVHSAKIDGKVMEYKNTTPKLNYDDSDGIPHPGITIGNTMPKKEKKKKSEGIPGQTIKQYDVTPGIINKREPPKKRNTLKNDN